MQLTAVFIPSETGSPREVVAASETKVGLPSADRLTALLETVRLRLEGKSMTARSYLCGPADRFCVCGTSVT